MRTFPLLICGILMPAAALQAREPTDLEQYYLELVNRARANPNGEVTRLSGEIWGVMKGIRYPRISTRALRREPSLPRRNLRSPSTSD